MKTLFRYKGIEHGYRIINGRVHNYKTSEEWDIIIAMMAKSAEYHSVSKIDKKILCREKMELCHNWG